MPIHERVFGYLLKKTRFYWGVSENRYTYRYTKPGLYIYLIFIGGITMQRREKGTGTIVQRESGTWSGRVSIGCGFDGKIKYKYFSGKTEAEVKRKIREYNKIIRLLARSVPLPC